MRFLLAAFLALPCLVTAAETRGTSATDDVFAVWVENARPSGLFVASMFGHQSHRIALDELCPWQPSRKFLMLAVHVDCARLTTSMEGQ